MSIAGINVGETMTSQREAPSPVQLPAPRTRAHLARPDGLPAVDLVADLAEASIVGDPDELTATAEALEAIAAVILVAAQEYRKLGRSEHTEVFVESGRHYLLPMCSCGQALGHPLGAFS